MQIKFLWTWGFVDTEYWDSSAMVHLNQKNILIDCWASIFRKLQEVGVRDTVDYVLLTHLHGDHIGSLFHLIAYYRGYLKKRLKIIYCTQEHLTLLRTFMKFWFPERLEEAVEFVDIDTVAWCRCIDTFGLHFTWLSSFAYVFTEDKEEVFYSWDLWDIGVVKSYLAKLSVGIHSTMYHGVNFGRPSTSHCSYKELEELELGENKLYVYHCNPEKKPLWSRLTCVADTDILLY